MQQSLAYTQGDGRRRSDPACNGRPRILSGMGQGASGASPGRCSEYPTECKALARSSAGQRIPASGDRGAGQGHIERVVRTGR